MDLSDKELNTLFCKKIGIKKACYLVINPVTKEAKTLSNLNKVPKSWDNPKIIEFTEKYPDFINNINNFMMLLNVQWNMFGHLGDSYEKQSDESFQYNYLKTKLKAIDLCNSFGGGEMLEEYKKEVRKQPFDYISDIILEELNKTGRLNNEG